MSISFSSGEHVLVFPFPAQGHMLPLLDFSYVLSRRGLTITILVTPKNLPILKPLLSKSPQIQTLILPFPECPSIPPSVENVKDLPRHVLGLSTRTFMRALAALRDPIIQWFRSHPAPPIAIISDFFLGWTHHLACQIGIPRVVFFPSSPSSQAFFNGLWRTMPKLPDPADQNSAVSFPELPNSPKYPWSQISPLYRNYREGDPDSEFLRNGVMANLASWGAVFNTFGEMEREYLEFMKTDLGHPRVWAVGPLLQLVGSTERGGPGSLSAEEVMNWLDRRPEGSVVYVCFGSQVVLSAPQVEALASALDSSGAQFVWSIKVAADGRSGVPVGFDQRVDGRGLIIRGWAPQVAILGHRATGSFLTHCGWNSTMEGIVAGVALLAWPMGADQFLNATLVNQMGIGKRVCEGGQTVPDSAGLAQALAESVSGNWPERVRAKELSRVALGAVQEGGSSTGDIDNFVELLVSTSQRRAAVA